MAKGNFLVFLRKLSLFLLLIFVALGSYLSRVNATNWEDSLWVAVYPINGDGSEVTERYIDTLTDDQFADIEQFMMNEAERFALPLEKPLRIDLGQAIEEQPPLPPTTQSFFDIAIWSLKLRYWASEATSKQTGPTPDVRIFLRLFDPATAPALSHSVGLKEGMIGIVNGYAKPSMEGSNSFVVLHEVFHTLGATDKYDRNNQPVFPDGFAEPELRPLYPQRYAELMGGRIVLNDSSAEIPSSLRQVRVGELSASEINWLQR
jgi:hypothetical protein